jgi:uncharacterized protein (DUF427 family)
MPPARESVWDYPRPPRLEASPRHLQVLYAGRIIADTTAGYRVLETSHPPTYYFPPADVDEAVLVPEPTRSHCEFKGEARYWSLRAGPHFSRTAVWAYMDPTPAFAAIGGYYCFYPGRVDACFVDGERVRSQAGDFYGGWITGDIAGPFKGGPGTTGW